MKIQWASKKWIVVLIHFFAWSLLFSLPYLLRPGYNSHENTHTVKTGNPVYFSIIMDFLWVILFYLNALFFIPKLIYRKKNWMFALLLLITFATYLGLSVTLAHYFFNSDNYNFRGNLLFTFFIFLFIMALSTAYQMIRDRMRLESLTKEKETEYLKTELSFLRSQVSPHFMFNVLNNMVALARKQSDQLEPSLIKLSSLLRYMLYETDDEKVLLSKEIEYLQSYIDLQQQRFGKKVRINVKFEQPDKDYTIAPMLLIPFVENAFKHGAGVSSEAQIDIELAVKNGLLYLLVRNKFDDVQVEYKDKTSGIGLNNVERRLQLLYDKDFTLHINKDENWFVVSLQLNLH